jgi:hypothetical protein
MDYNGWSNDMQNLPVIINKTYISYQLSIDPIICVTLILPNCCKYFQNYHITRNKIVDCTLAQFHLKHILDYHSLLMVSLEAVAPVLW